MDINYVTGDATRPADDGPKIIAHICNDVGAWGKGFVTAISQRWPEPKASYLSWKSGTGHQPFELGATQVVQVEDDLWVANMIAERDIAKHDSDEVPIRYEALEAALSSLADEAYAMDASVHMPRIGCGLAGGSWDHIEPIIERTLLDRYVPVTVYDFD